MFVDDVGDGNGWCHFEEVGCDASVQAGQAFGGDDGAEYSGHGHGWAGRRSSAYAAYGFKCNCHPESQAKKPGQILRRTQGADAN